jgi:hypothetical protein
MTHEEAGKYITDSRTVRNATWPELYDLGELGFAMVQPLDKGTMTHFVEAKNVRREFCTPPPPAPPRPTDTRPLSERMRTTTISLDNYDFCVLTVELSRRVEALEARPATITASDMAAMATETPIADTETAFLFSIEQMLSQVGAFAEEKSPETRSQIHIIHDRVHALFDMYQRAVSQVAELDRLSRKQVGMIETARAELATARAEGAEAERKRIVDALRNCDWSDLVLLQHGEVPGRISKEGGDR